MRLNEVIDMADREKVIKATELLDDFFNEYREVYYISPHEAWEIIKDTLKEQEAVVRCKDCKRRGTYDCPVYVGGDGMYSEPDDWFCGDGKKKERS